MKALMLAFNKRIQEEFAAKLASGSLPSRAHTPEQEYAISCGLDPDIGSLLDEAVAGSGKTYILLRQALASPYDWECKTMHGLGYRAWSGKLGRRLIVESDKSFKILKSLELDVEREVFGDILKLVSIAKNSGIVPKTLSRGRSLVDDDPLTWDDLGDMYDVEVSESVIAAVRQVLEASIEAANAGKIDFDDMLYMPICFYGVWDKYPLVLVDEVQDLSRIQHKMLEKVLAPSGRLIAAGDRHQAIYGFRGALSESIPELTQTFSMTSCPLTVSFRCPKAVIEEAQKDVPHISAAPSAPDGEVLYPSELALTEVPRTVICRNTAPIVSLALRLLGAGRGATIAGREVGKSLVRLVQKISKEDMSTTDFQAKLDSYVNAEIARKPSKEPRLRDQQAALSAIASRAAALGDPTTSSVIKIIEQLYDKNSPNGVLLSTVHKAKGLEWPEVLFLDPHLIPSAYAKQDWMLQQEHNLRYVGVTRAQQRLIFCASQDIY